MTFRRLFFVNKRACLSWLWLLVLLQANQSAALLPNIGPFKVGSKLLGRSGYYYSSNQIQGLVDRRRTGSDSTISCRASNVNSTDSVSSAGTESSPVIDPLASFDWTKQWYPVIPVQDLNKNTPNRMTLLGMDFVVWFHEPSDGWCAFADVCPHRLVPLSEGRIESSSNTLQCAYHGWEFNNKGECTKIPQLGGDHGDVSSSSPAAATNSPRACATSFPICTRQGLVWIFPTFDHALAATQDLPLIPEFDDPTYVDATNFFVRDMPYSWDVLVENLCDPSHVPFAHHSFMSGADRNQKESMQIDMNVVEETSDGFCAKRDPYPSGGGKYDVKFQAPCLLFYTIVGSTSSDIINKQKEASFLGLGQYCIPTAPGQSRIIARFPFRLPFKPAMFVIRHTPRWMTHFSQNVVMDSDVVFLSSQDDLLSRRRDNPTSRTEQPNYYMPARCDAMVVAFRKWLSKHGNGGPTWLGLPAERSLGEPLGWLRPQSVPLRGGRDALLDRYRQHTEVCSSCRAAHRNLYRLREAMTYGGILLLAGAAVSPSSVSGFCARRLAATAGAAMLLAPRLFIRPLIARMECVPWPRQKWVKSKDS